MKEFERWLKKAEEDLYVTQHLLTLNDAPPTICCFHAQQAVEKYLKAYLITKNILVPKTHDLELLVKLSTDINPLFNDILSKANSLSNYSVIPRYPDMLDDLTIEDAKKAYRKALEIKHFILKNFF